MSDERVSSTALALPVQAGPGYLCHLTEACWWLGVVAGEDRGLGSRGWRRPTVVEPPV
ncbi:hypothetical protein ACP70R_001119 [Stipagrostis hirtigluma subsp. patula]